MSPPATAKAKNAARGAPRDRALTLVRLLVAALLFASASASIALEPAPAAGEQAGLGSEALIAGWLLVFLALSALYSFERRHRAKVGLAAYGIATRSRGVGDAPPARGAAERAAGVDRRPIDLLLKKKPTASAGERPPAPVIPAPKLTLPEESTLLRRPASRGVRESGEESFSVAASHAPAPPDPPSGPSRLERCAALRAERRFEEAARVAREGLAGDDDPGPLLIELSRAELALGRVNAAIDTARDAHFAARSRDSLSHLIRLLTETRRFARNDGAALRRAALRHPDQALLRHAAGVFESMYGEPRAAAQELRAALRLASDTEVRRAIERDLARVSR